MDEKDYFIEKLERAITRWPDNIMWGVVQLSSYTTYPTDEVLSWLNQGSDKTIESDDFLKREDVQTISERLKKNQVSIKKAQAKKYLESLIQIKEKIRLYTMQKDWRKAYQSLSYFLGEKFEELSFDDKLELLNESLRLGFKAERTEQELGTVLAKLIDESFINCDKERINDLLDTVEAFKDDFNKTQNGAKIILAAFLRVEEKAKKYGE